MQLDNLEEDSLLAASCASWSAELTVRERQGIPCQSPISL